MSTTLEVDVTDNATPELERRLDSVSMARVQRAVGTAVSLLEKNNFDALPTNKQGWPSTGFYSKASRSVEWEPTADGVRITADIPGMEGAVRQRYRGGPIPNGGGSGKLLTIPARAEFYGHRATEFTNLRFVPFKSGAKALVIGAGGTDRYDFARNREMRVKGAGAKSASMVAYWLVDSVEQEGDPAVLPPPAEIAETAKRMVRALWNGGGE